MATPSAPEGEPGRDAPFLPPAGPVTPFGAPTLTADAPTLPSSRPADPLDLPALPPPVASAPEPTQPRVGADPVYGAMPTGTDESRAAARRLREQANRKRRRNAITARIVVLLLLVGAAVAGYLSYQATQDDAPPTDGSGDDGALTPAGEEQPAADALDDVEAGATPSAGGLLDAVDDARDAVEQAEPPTAGEATLSIGDLLTPAVLDHTDVLAATDGYDRYVVRTDDLVASDPDAHAALVERLLTFPQAVEGEPQLAVAPVVPPGDIGIAIQRDGDTVTRIVAVATDPAIRSVGP